jgi:hypothetical protein
MSSAFLTLSVDLASLADELETYLDANGYDLVREPDDLSFPETPAFSASRDGVTFLVVVVQAYSQRLVDKWWAYGQSAGVPTGVIIFSADPLAQEALLYARGKRFGIIAKAPAGMSVLCVAGDLTVNMVPPDLNGEGRKLRQLLAGPFEEVRDGHWKRGFENCCRCLETQARNYFTDGVNTSRIKTQTVKGKDNTPTAAQIERMSIGDMEACFSGIVTRTKADDVLVSCLTRIRKERNAIVHAKPAEEVAARQKAGTHIHAIFNTLKQIL